MTHNVWEYDTNSPKWEEKGEDCSAIARAKGMVRVYTETQPDIIGFQEMSNTMADEIIRGLADLGKRYTLLKGGDTPILYHQDRFELIDSDFLLYPTEVPNFEGEFNNSGTKSWCIAVFKDKTDGKKLIFMSTHLWWMSSNPNFKSYQAGSDEAREYQLNMAINRLEELKTQYDCPVILVGDLNANYNSNTVQSALKRGYLHAHDIATDFTDEDWGYHYCFGDGYKPYIEKSFEYGIDHILVKYTPKNFVSRFERYTPDYYLPLSDHSPVFIDAIL
jgi:endonuclease/exonuclease/phosphatase family metal-dependent hydrolase